MESLFEISDQIRGLILNMILRYLYVRFELLRVFFWSIKFVVNKRRHYNTLYVYKQEVGKGPYV